MGWRAVVRCRKRRRARCCGEIGIGCSRGATGKLRARARARVQTGLLYIELLVSACGHRATKNTRDTAVRARAIRRRGEQRGSLPRSPSCLSPGTAIAIPLNTPVNTVSLSTFVSCLFIFGRRGEGGREEGGKDGLGRGRRGRRRPRGEKGTQQKKKRRAGVRESDSITALARGRGFGGPVRSPAAGWRPGWRPGGLKGRRRPWDITRVRIHTRSKNNRTPYAQHASQRIAHHICTTRVAPHNNTHHMQYCNMAKEIKKK
jgi:hypothetical protein